MPSTDFPIAEGITLHYLPDDRFKANVFTLNFIAPLEKESVSANALFPAVLLRGCEKYPTTAALSRRLSYLYGTAFSSRTAKRGEKLVFGFSLNLLSPSFVPDGSDLMGDVLDVLGDVLFHPLTEGDGFLPSFTEREKQNLIDTINANINDKVYYAHTRCIEEMCKDERFAVSENGSIEGVSACTPASLYKQYRYALTSYPIEIFFVGSCNAEKLASDLRSLFMGCERHPIGLPDTEFRRHAGNVKRITEPMTVSQGKLMLGFRTELVAGEEGETAFLLFNAIFGDGVTSKLFTNVREKKSLCYDCSSRWNPLKGILTVFCGLETENRAVAEEAILEELKKTQDGMISDEELESARLDLINRFRSMADSAYAIESRTLSCLLIGKPADLDRAIKRLLSLTREDVIAASRKLSLDTVYFLEGTLAGEKEEEDA